jgi:hypothetical protein
MPSVFAHELWFHEAIGTDWSFAFETLTLVLLAAAVALTVAVRVIARAFPGLDVGFLGKLAPWMPFAVRIHLAVSLVGLLSMGDYLSPAMDLQSDLGGILLGIVMAIVAILMATGFRTREAAWLLVASGPLGMLEFGLWDVLQRVDLLGLACFILFAGPGRWSADFEAGHATDPTPERDARAVWSLRVGAGLALIVVAFAEKLAAPGLAVAFLEQHPHLNVAQQVGLDMSHLEFARLTGGIEVLFGLLVISGALSQAAVLIAGVPFNATLWFFGTTELVGHLPIYGAMLVLLVYASDPARRPGVSGLWPFGPPQAGVARTTRIARSSLRATG